MLLLSAYFNEKDVEIPQLLSFVDKHSKDIATILDVGCFGSLYLKDLRERDKIVDGIALNSREKEKEFLRNYFVGNAITYPLEQYDLVVCISAIEHTGIKRYQILPKTYPERYHVWLFDDFVKEQNVLFKKLADVSKRFMYVTFPYGTGGIAEGECVNMTRNRLDQFLKVVPNQAVCKMRFYFNDYAPSKVPWREISQNDADKVQRDPRKGCRCVCILEVIL